VTVAGGKEAKVAHLDKALRQHMLQETVDESVDWQGDSGAPSALVVFIPEGDLVLGQLDEAAIADADAKQVVGQIGSRFDTVANGLAVDDPLFVPDSGWHVSQETSFLQAGAELGAKETGQWFDMHKEMVAGVQPAFLDKV